MPISISASKGKKLPPYQAQTSRGDVAGILSKACAAARDPHLAGPIGMLKAQGLITERQARAADAYAEVRIGPCPGRAGRPLRHPMPR